MGYRINYIHFHEVGESHILYTDVMAFSTYRKLCKRALRISKCKGDWFTISLFDKNAPNGEKLLSRFENGILKNEPSDR